jgi:hypothetical protein
MRSAQDRSQGDLHFSFFILSPRGGTIWSIHETERDRRTGLSFFRHCWERHMDCSRLGSLELP